MKSLVNHKTVLAVLGSGSAGNSYYIGNGRSGVLVDCGLSTKQILLRMAQLGLAGAPIHAVCITHEHRDHVAAAAVLDRSLYKKTGQRTPFYMSAGTAHALPPTIRPTCIAPIRAGQSIQVGNLAVSAHEVPHDSEEPLGFVVEGLHTRIGIITDLGHATPIVERVLSSLHIAVLEFNHDPGKLAAGPYPWALKQRVGGPLGHLSNHQAEQLLAHAASHRLQRVVLAHLSEQNNTPELALTACERALNRAGQRGVRVRVARQHAPTGPVMIGPVAQAASPPSPRRAILGRQVSLF